MKNCPFQTEQTAQGEQAPVPSVKSITRRARLRALIDAPLLPKRAQRPCNVGFFDEKACAQLDLLIHRSPKEKMLCK